MPLDGDSMPGRRKQIRRIAAHMLLVWLFALGVGIVNACVLGPELVRSVTSAALDAHGAGAAHESHGGHASGTHGHPSPHDGTAPCAKFCDQLSVGAQADRQQLDPFNAAWLGPIPSGSIAIGAAALVLSAQSIDPIRWRPAIPIAIAFLRLTL